MKPTRTPGLRQEVQAKSPSKPGHSSLSHEFVCSDDDSDNNTPSLYREAPPTAVKGTPDKVQGSVNSTSRTALRERGGCRLLAAAVEKRDQTPLQQLPHRQKDQNTGSDAGSSSSSSSNANESESESSSESSSDKPVVKQAKLPSKQQAQSHNAKAQITQPFVPPHGFQPIPVKDKTTLKESSIFDNLDDKEVWHLTTPSGMSIETLTELAMDAVSKRKIVFEHKGTNYGLTRVRESEGGTKEVMISTQQGFRVISAGVSQSLHLNAVIRQPTFRYNEIKTNTPSSSASLITRSTIRAPRDQAEGLQMRFLPTGFSNISRIVCEGSGDARVEMKSNGLIKDYAMRDAFRQVEKRPRPAVDDETDTEQAQKRKKKHLDPARLKKKAEKQAKKEKRLAREQ